VKPVPVIATVVLPASGPVVGLSEVTVGSGAYVNWSADEVALVPEGVVTVTSTVPVPAGLTAVICVSLSTVKLVAAVAPNETTVAPVKPVPVIATVVLPASGPVVGLSEVTVGSAETVFLENEFDPAPKARPLGTRRRNHTESATSAMNGARRSPRVARRPPPTERR
jgi:hypothetical protein